MSSILHREDFSLGPISVDEIEPGLFLGSWAAAKDIETLSKLRVSHIITIDTCPLPRNITDLSHLTTKFIQLSDQPKEDLLSHFDDCIHFIEQGLSKGVVFVHCYFGVSRSATVVIAYVMKKYQLTYTEAFEKVKSKRHIVFPNQGFVTQLKIYKDMGYTIDKSNIHYKLYRLSLAADRVKKVKILPHNFIDLIQPVRNRILKNRELKISEERAGLTTEDDTISELKIGRYWTKEERKKHLEKSRERKQRQEILTASRHIEEITEEHNMKSSSRKVANNIDNTAKKHRTKSRPHKEKDGHDTTQDVIGHGQKPPPTNGKLMGLLSVTTV